MNKKLSLFVMFLLISTSLCFAVLSRNDAEILLLSSIVSDRISQVDVYLYDEVMTLNENVACAGYTVLTPYNSNWVAFVDEALQKGYKVRYFSMCDFVEEMIIRVASSKYKEWLKEVLRNDLIVLDEIGYLPIDPRYTHLFFQFINECYEYRSVLITSNKMPAQWGNYFGDESVAMAILDRLMHHSEIVIMNGDSYRLKDKLDTLKASEKFSDGALERSGKAPSENFN